MKTKDIIFFIFSLVMLFPFLPILLYYIYLDIKLKDLGSDKDG